MSHTSAALLVLECARGAESSLLPAKSSAPLAPMGDRGVARTLPETPYHLPGIVDIDGIGRRHLGQAGHGHDVTTDHHDELGTSGEAHLANVHQVTVRRAAEFRIRREGVLSLRHAHRIVSV